MNEERSDMKKILPLIMVLVFVLTGCVGDSSDPQGRKPVSEPEAAFLRVHFIDVGQGDAVFIELPNEQTMLIDAGDTGYGDTVANYIRSNGYASLDYVVATHPHADHIGGMAAALNATDVGAVYMPHIETTTQTFENLLDTIEAKGLKIKTARAGTNILSAGGLSIDILAPNAEKYSDLNNYSAVVKISYGETAFLFMGDAEALSETEIRGDVRADVVKVGHHGSDSSSSPEFIGRTQARYAIVSVGAGNIYDHPSPVTIKNWVDAGAKVYRTDENGTIIALSDGIDVMISAKASAESPETGKDALSGDSPNRGESKSEASATSEWTLNTNTKKIHYPECRVVSRISPENYATSDKTVAELLNEGFTECGICKPHD
jgi:competence protein ComEC